MLPILENQCWCFLPFKAHDLFVIDQKDLIMKEKMNDLRQFLEERKGLKEPGEGSLLDMAVDGLLRDRDIDWNLSTSELLPDVRLKFYWSKNEEGYEALMKGFRHWKASQN